MGTPIPGARFGLISGSPTWGIDFPRDLREDGVRVLEHNLTASARSVAESTCGSINRAVQRVTSRFIPDDVLQRESSQGHRADTTTGY